MPPQSIKWTSSATAKHIFYYQLAAGCTACGVCTPVGGRFVGSFNECPDIIPKNRVIASVEHFQVLEAWLCQAKQEVVCYGDLLPGPAGVQRMYRHSRKRFSGYSIVSDGGIARRYRNLPVRRHFRGCAWRRHVPQLYSRPTSTSPTIAV